MPSQFTYQITDTVNNMVACDQMELEIESDVTIVTALSEGSIGVMCTPSVVIFNFVSDLAQVEIDALTALVSAHTGVGLASPNNMDSLTVATLPATAEVGDSFYLTDGASGPGPVYYNGAGWFWYSDNSAVV